MAPKSYDVFLYKGFLQEINRNLIKNRGFELFKQKKK